MTKTTSTSTSTTPAPTEDATDWQFVTPQLPVADVREAQAYYRDMLGFKIAWIWREEYGAVYNGTTEIFFVREEGEIQPSCSFVRVENADETPHLRGVTPDGEIFTLARNAKNKSEFAGSTFSPDGTILFVNIQTPGIPLAITGPWRS